MQKTGFPEERSFDYLIVGERELKLINAGIYGQSLEDIGMSCIYTTGSTAVYAPPY